LETVRYNWNTKDKGKMEQEMEKVYYIIQMDYVIKVSLKIISDMDLVFFDLIWFNYIVENGKKMSYLVKEN